MARNPIVTPEVENYISQVYSLHKSWKAPQVQREVVYNLNHDLKLRKRLNLPSNLPKNWPGLNKVQRVLADIRLYNKDHLLDPQDKPWSIAALEDPPRGFAIESQAIRVVILLYFYRINGGYSKLTIREAKWASRLAGVYLEDVDLISDFITDKERIKFAHGQNIDYDSGKNIIDRKLSWLSYTAFAYAFFEQNYQKIREGSGEFNSEIIDDLLFPPEPPLSSAAEKAWNIIDAAYNKFVLGVKNERTHNQEG